jgi:hypothetical protein
LNPTETVLTPANVNSARFGLLRLLQVDGKVDAQPLYLSHLSIGSATHNVVFVATENDSAYAFDVDSGAVLWHVSLLGSGGTTGDGQGCDQVVPTIGVTATPVIDRSAAGGHGAIYLVAMTKDGAGYHQRLHALDATTGVELSGSPTEITATYPIASGTTSFDPGRYEERAALLLYNGTIYLSWTSHCDTLPYSGWVMAYSGSTLAQTAVLNLGPNSASDSVNPLGPAIWMSGNGPAVDASGNLYLLTANGAFETTLDANGFPSNKDYGNSFVKISTAGGGLAVSDYFALKDGVTKSHNDTDLGSGGEILLPDLTDSSSTVRHLVVGAGKDGNIYVVNRDSMGHFSPSANNIWQELDNLWPSGQAGNDTGIYSTPAYFNNTVYYANVGGTLKAFTVSSAKLSSAPAMQTTVSFTYPGASPAVSANGTANGIVWVYENSNPAVLHAYDASNLANELYNSSQAANTRDQFGNGAKFITPTIVDGKVFVPGIQINSTTLSQVAVFGLLP